MKMILTQNSFFPVIFGVYINVLPEVVEMLFSKILNQLQSLFFFYKSGFDLNIIMIINKSWRKIP